MNYFNKLYNQVHETNHIAPLVIFRIIFGFMMCISVLRFAWNGWINSLYIQPAFYFPYYGFEWVKPLNEIGIYLIFGIMFLSSLGILLGWFYRVSSILFFITFTYVELIDKTNYLNHYYFVSIVSALLIFLPTHAYFSIDSNYRKLIYKEFIPKWMLIAIKLQLGIVYFYAGIAKLNYDWIFRAMPLKIWLKAQTSLPLIGDLFRYDITAYLFSWSGAIYDLLIPFVLINNRLRPYGYVVVIVFHVLTRVMFPIGMFPYIMILSTLIFFDVNFHKKVILFLQNLLRLSPNKESALPKKGLKSFRNQLIYRIFALHFTVQLIFPFRYLLYPDDLFWTEEGFRFSWRVMLVEKAGYAIFEVTNPETQQKFEINNQTYLTAQQEKMMAIQPDMILQFAHFLGEEMRKKGIKNPEIRVKSYVTVNGSGSRPYIDSKIDLMKIEDSFQHKTWILPFNKSNN